MTTTDTDVTTARDVLDAARGLAPSIAGRADEIEAGRRVPRDLLDELIAARVLRLLRPAIHGGAGADLPGAMRVYEALARADASVGWTVMIGSGSWCDLAPLPRATFDALFSDAPDVITAGVFSPTGSVEAAGDGYRVAGRWSFASGCEHADWIHGNCVEAVVNPVEVPAQRTLDPMADAPSIDAPIVRVPPPALFALAIASVAVGCARGALDDIVALAADKVPLLHGRPLAADPTFQLALATADPELSAARALIYETADAAWKRAVEAAERAADVVMAAYRSGGGGAIYAASPLQRRLRDINALTQHFLVSRDTLTTAGAVLVGQDVEVMVF